MSCIHNPKIGQVEILGISSPHSELSATFCHEKPGFYSLASGRAASVPCRTGRIRVPNRALSYDVLCTQTVSNILQIVPKLPTKQFCKSWKFLKPTNIGDLHLQHRSRTPLKKDAFTYFWMVSLWAPPSVCQDEAAWNGSFCAAVESEGTPMSRSSTGMVLRLEVDHEHPSSP